MNLNNDRQITISVGTNRHSKQWRARAVSLSDFYETLATPQKSAETMQEYLALPKSEQDDLKDVGGFVGGELNGTRRKAAAVKGRDLITLDFDNMPGWSVDKLLATLDGLQTSYCVYSTRKHRPEAPRLRVIVPTDRTMTADEYEPCARRVAALIGITMTDPTTFDVSRLMYWPSVCSDGQYVYKWYDCPLASVDALLASYTDWHDRAEWPQVPGAVNYQKLAVKQGDPESKPGIVGAFCRVFDIYRAMDELLPGIYAPVDNAPDRYTYLGGSTTGGAVIYDSGKFLFSHHATDPCGGRLVNAFDMVRLHMFGDRDDNAAPDTVTNKLPSYKAMCEYAMANNEVSTALLRERYDSVAADFAGVGPTNDDDPANWIALLACTSTGKILSTIDNVCIILEHDPALCGRFAHNLFANRGEVLGALPWNASPKRRMWSDTDSNGMYWYCEKRFNITGRGNIDAALDIHSQTHAFNEVQDFLRGLVWDGTPRLDALFVDYLGAEDTPYTRAVSRKAFAAAVARAMEPGCKFDNMLILCGPQGIGKSTLLDKMSKGWFNDSIRTFEGKEASELLQGVWLVEIAELDAFRRTDVARIKQFLSLRADRFRAAYGRNVKELPRCCVFFGTCNQMEFLQDTTGNRRFWPVNVGEHPHPLNVWDDLTDDVIAQLWAEAKAYWMMGEPLYLTGDIEQAAVKAQEEHRETSPHEGLILDFVAKRVPVDWARWDVSPRRDFWAGATHAAGDAKPELVDRDKICAVEVYVELLNGNVRYMTRQDAREINSVLSRMEGWRRQSVRCGPYGVQYGFVRTAKV